MLTDLKSPRSQAIFAAVGRLNALGRLWEATEAAPPAEVDAHIDCLHSLASAHFSESKEIAVWLDELTVLVKADPATRLAAKSKYDDLVYDKLYGIKGFCRVCI